jgi:hypothetical protein
MNVRCWNCGNDQEVFLDDVRAQVKNQIMQQLQYMSNLYATTGFPLRVDVISDVLRAVRTIRL